MSFASWPFRVVLKWLCKLILLEGKELSTYEVILQGSYAYFRFVVVVAFGEVGTLTGATDYWSADFVRVALVPHVRHATQIQYAILFSSCASLAWLEYVDEERGRIQEGFRRMKFTILHSFYRAYLPTIHSPRPRPRASIFETKTGSTAPCTHYFFCPTQSWPFLSQPLSGLLVSPSRKSTRLQILSSSGRCEEVCALSVIRYFAWEHCRTIGLERSD